jgi:hypothetical protein
MAVVGRLAETGRRGRLGLFKAEFIAMFHAGFDLFCTYGHHRRLALVIITFGASVACVDGPLRTFAFVMRWTLLGS